MDVDVHVDVRVYQCMFTCVFMSDVDGGCTMCMLDVDVNMDVDV